MSVSYIPNRTKLCLWGKAAGRCQYAGCNQVLYLDELTKTQFNSAYIAHIVADSADGPRGDPVRSELLKADLSNLMLLCDVHHRLVDIQDVPGHPEERLIRMKQEHEKRMSLLTSIHEDLRSHVVLYDARIGEHDAKVNFEKAACAMAPRRYPAESRAIELGLKNSLFEDSESDFWTIEVEHLHRQYNTKVKPLLSAGEAPHLSVFGFAPIPLLIEFGRLLSDIPAADIYQLHREPPTWNWQPGPEDFTFCVETTGIPDTKTVALILALSSDIAPERVHEVLGKQISIWTITHETPGNDFVKNSEQLRSFRETLRDVLNRIKATHGEDAELHVFPAIPVSLAIEVGRVWMPKADLPFQVYDQNRSASERGFVPVLRIE